MSLCLNQGQSQYHRLYPCSPHQIQAYQLHQHHNHISQMIIQAILHNKSLAVLVSDYNLHQDNQNWIKLHDLMKHNFQLAFLKATMNSDLSDYLGEYYDD